MVLTTSAGTDNGAMDWNGLASQSLPSSNNAVNEDANGGTTARMNRGLSQLHAASQMLLGSESGGPNSVAGAQALLGSSYYYPLTTLTSDGGPRVSAGGHQLTSQTTTSATGMGLSLEEKLERYEKSLIQDILTSVNETTTAKINSRIERQIELAWEKERDVWLREIVGTRTLGGAAALSALSSGGSPLGALTQYTTKDGGGANNSLIIPSSRSTDGAMASTAPRPLPLMMPSSEPPSTKLDGDIVRAHLSLVRDTLTPDSSSFSIRSYMRIMQEHPFDHRPAIDAGYRSAWNLVDRLVSLSSSSGSGADVTDPIQRARASLAFLTQSFRQMVLDQLRRSAQWDSGITSAMRRRYGNNTTAQTCAAYVQLVAPPPMQLAGSKGTGSSSSSSNSSSVLFDWATLYYCLRCGDYVAGYAVASASTTIMEDLPAPVQRLLKEWSTLQRDAVSVWETSTTAGGGSIALFSQLNLNDRHAVADLCQSMLQQQQQQEQGMNAYATGVYALVAAMIQPPLSETDIIGMNAIEDYLTFAITKAILSDQNNGPVDELAHLGNVLTNQLGPGHFNDGGESGGWSFALPLLVAQQYYHALAHLQRAGGALGLLQAAHLALVLSRVVRIPTTNLSSGTLPASQKQAEEEAQGFVVSLLSAYANLLLADADAVGGAETALEYLVRIPNKPRAAKEVAALIRKTQAIDTLVGTLNEQGMRQGNPVLEAFFDQNQVTSILVDAAEQLLRGGSGTSVMFRMQQQQRPDRQTTGNAVMCYMLAGRYANVLQLLSRLISPPDVMDEDHAFWREQTESFHQFYVTKPTNVLRTLEKTPEGSTAITTSRTLLRLNHFFSLLHANQTQDAWNTADSLQLLPSSQSDLALKESDYKSLDTLIKAALPSLLVGAVQVLYQEHRRLKQQPQRQQGYFSGSAMSGEVTRERLRELQEKARLLVTYSGLVGMTPEQKQTLSRLEAQMI